MVAVTHDRRLLWLFSNVSAVAYGLNKSGTDVRYGEENSNSFV